MQQVSGWPSDFSATVPSVSVQIGGKFYDPLSWDYTAESSTGLPVAVAGGSGVRAATATLTFPPGEGTVSADSASPWAVGVWPPSRGDRCILKAGYGSAMAQLLDGYVSQVSGGVDEPVVVEVIDRIDNLNRRVNFDPYMATSPRIDWTTDENLISRGLQSTFFLDRAAATCGFYALPQPAGGNFNVFYASMNGALIPTRGTVTSSSKNAATRYDRWPLWKPAPWGQGAYDLLANIKPAESAPGAARVTTSRPLRVSFTRGVAGTIGSGITVFWGADAVKVQYDRANNTVWVQSEIGGTLTRSTGVTLALDETVVVSYNHGGGYEIRTSAGRTAAGNIGWASAFETSSATQIRVAIPADGTQIAAAQVYFSDDWAPLNFTRTFLLDPASTIGTLDGTRAWSGTALELINEICEAELSSAYIDGTGRLILKNRSSLTTQAPATTKDTTGHLLSLPWEVKDHAMRRIVYVSGENVHAETSPKPAITVYQGSGDNVAEGTVQNIFFEPDSDEEFVAVMPTVWGRGEGENFAGYPSSFNQGLYSWVIGSAGEGADEHYLSPTATIDQLGPRKWLVKVDAPANMLLRVPEAPNNGSAVGGKWRGEKTPIIRAKGRMRFEKFDQPATIMGPAWAPDLTHDGGMWVQGSENAEIIADFISRWTSVPLVDLKDLGIVPDHRIERNDLLIIRDPYAYDVQVRALVTGITLSGSDGKCEMSVSVQVVSATRLGYEYGEQAAAWVGKTYENQRTLWASKPTNSYAAQITAAADTE